MLEIAKRKEYIPKIEAPKEKLSRKVVEDFIESVPVGEDLFQGKDKRNEAFRASSFLGILNSLDSILDHFDELSREDQESVLARTGSVVLEAHRWSHISSTKDIQRELENKITRVRIAARNRPKLRIVREKYRI